MNSDLIPIVDPALGHVIGYKDRRLVHSEGDFHVGIQAYIVCTNEEGQIEVLVQKRSGVVDIAKGQLDQSLATQILAKDGGGLRAALIRGLKEELDIDEEEIEAVPLGLHSELKIYKKYAADPDLYNREFIYLSFVQIKRRDIRSKNPKVADLEWVSWAEYVRRMKESPENFTKTAWFYIMNPDILHQTEQELERFINKASTKPLLCPLEKAYFYSYPGRYDITISVYKDKRVFMHVFDHKTKKIARFDDIRSVDPCEGKNHRHVAVYITKKSGENFLWLNGDMKRIHRQADTHSKRCLAKMTAQILKDIARLEEEAASDQDLKLAWALKRKFNYIFDILRTRVLSGEMLFFDSLPADETGDFGIREYPDNIILVTIPGTYDPPHYAHIELLFDAMIHESENAHGKRTAYALFFTPVGDFAPGPSGTSWKSEKTDSKTRHEMCSKVSGLFYPLMQTSEISLRHPEEFGTKNAASLLKALRDRTEFTPVRFVVAIGTDTYRKWGKNISAVLQEEKGKYPGVDFSVLIRESWQDPLEDNLAAGLPEGVKLLKGVYSLPVRSTRVREGHMNLLPGSVQKYIKLHGLYPSAPAVTAGAAEVPPVSEIPKTDLQNEAA
ncbi:MAG TPA: NUDIX domain-containing protein [Verrucomicrobiae bacterium]|nr:NUDIX domain-containing protein [Verrucomicrobiae bacterium]